MFLWSQIEVTGCIYFSSDEVRALNNSQSSSFTINLATVKIDNSLKSTNLNLGFKAFTKTPTKIK